MLFETLPAEIRVCTWCCQPFEPTRDNFNFCKFGRHQLLTVCKNCQSHDAKILRRYRKLHPKPLACACGGTDMQIDHDHSDYPYAFRA